MGRTPCSSASSKIRRMVWRISRTLACAARTHDQHAVRAVPALVRAQLAAEHVDQLETGVLVRRRCAPGRYRAELVNLDAYPATRGQPGGNPVRAVPMSQPNL